MVVQKKVLIITMRIKNVVLFFLALSIGLAYIIVFPFVVVGSLAWAYYKALQKRPVESP